MHLVAALMFFVHLLQQAIQQAIRSSSSKSLLSQIYDRRPTADLVMKRIKYENVQSAGSSHEEMALQKLFRTHMESWLSGQGHVSHEWIDNLTTAQQRDKVRTSKTFRAELLLQIMTGAKLKPIGDSWKITVRSFIPLRILTYHLNSYPVLLVPI